jgi:hypothetical protein
MHSFATGHGNGKPAAAPPPAAPAPAPAPAPQANLGGAAPAVSFDPTPHTLMAFVGSTQATPPQALTVDYSLGTMEGPSGPSSSFSDLDNLLGLLGKDYGR